MVLGVARIFLLCFLLRFPQGSEQKLGNSLFALFSRMYTASILKQYVSKANNGENIIFRTGHFYGVDVGLVVSLECAMVG